MRIWHPRAPALRGLKRSRGTGPRATVFGTAPFTVGRGPVPRHATIAGETRSDARVASEGPRATVSSTAAFSVCSLRSPDRKRPRSELSRAPFYGGRGPVPRHANRLNQDLQDERIYKIRDSISNRCGAAGKRCFRSVGPVLSFSTEVSPPRGR